MKNKIIVLGLLLFNFFGCCDDYKKKLEDCEKKLELFKPYKHKYEKIESIQNLVMPIPNDIEDQTSIKIDQVPEKKMNAFLVSGKIDTEADEIELNIYVPENKLKIVNYLNISTNELNALLVVLDGNNGRRVGGSKPTKLINKKIKISKAGFDINQLKEHKKLIVIVLHDDSFNGAHVVGYMRKLIETPNYNNIENFLIKNWKVVYEVPDEDGGDIIP